MHDMFEYEGGIVWNSMVSFVSRGGQETLHDHRSLFYKNRTHLGDLALSSPIKWIQAT